jgi:N-acetylneuraminic acid mutarotase
VIASEVVLGSGGLVAQAACAPPAGHSAVRLADGRVLVTVSTEAHLTNWAQIYDPAADHWTPTAINRDGGVVATLLADGRVLLTAGQCDRTGPQLYDPRTNAVSDAGIMAVPNGGGYTPVLLRSGKVLFAGGYGGPVDVNTQPKDLAQIYDPATNSWKLSPPTLTQRLNPQAILLADGRVLVAGGNVSSTGPLPFLTSAEIYDPAGNIWSSAGQIPTNGYGTAALVALGNGMALAAGGGEDGRPTSTAELFDPSSRTWSKTAAMTYARSGAVSMTMTDGSAVVVSGQGVNGPPLTTAERFDPASGKWTVLPGGLKTATADQSAILLKDGKVFVAAWPEFVFGQWSTADAHVFDPMASAGSPSPSQSPAGAGTWSSLPDAAIPFGNFSLAGGGFSSTATATALTDGRVLLIGSSPTTAFNPPISANGVTAELYDPTSGQSHPVSAPQTISSVGFTATLLRNGKVLVVGEGAYLFDAATDAWVATGSVVEKRFGHTATLLADGRVLVAGGLAHSSANAGDQRLVAAEIYDPNSNRWSATFDTPFALGDSGDTATLLRDGRVLVVGGFNSSAAVYDPKSTRWAPVASLGEPAQVPHTATLLPDGKVIVLGGCAERPSFACSRFAPSQVFDPKTNGWSGAAPMLQGREGFSATLLRNGLVLVAGGYGPDWVVASSELYDPSANSWMGAGEMKVARAGPTATLLKSGSVLLLGGSFLGNTRSAELYSPRGGAQPSAPASSSSPQGGLNLPILAAAVLVVLAASFFLWARSRRISKVR